MACVTIYKNTKNTCLLRGGVKYWRHTTDNLMEVQVSVNFRCCLVYKAKIVRKCYPRKCPLTSKSCEVQALNQSVGSVLHEKRYRESGTGRGRGRGREWLIPIKVLPSLSLFFPLNIFFHSRVLIFSFFFCLYPFTFLILFPLTFIKSFF